MSLPCPDPDPRTARCMRCGRPTMTTRIGYRHEKPRCGAPMRYGEACARMAGHADCHRTRDALDYQRDSRRAA